MLAAAASASADTREGYQDSTTRQQIERMDENNRANAPDSSLNIPSTSVEGTALQGWMNNLQAEEDAARAKKAAEARQQQEELRDWFAAERQRMYEREVSMAATRQHENARDRQIIAGRQAQLAAYIDTLPRDTPIGPAAYDRMIDIVAPYSELMRPLVKLAYREFPREFAVRYGFMQLSTCDGLRTQATAYPGTLYDDENVLRDKCVMAQPSAAFPYLIEARQTGSPLDVALACALMAGARGSVPSFDPGIGPHLGDALHPRVSAWLDKRVQPCVTAAPAGTALYAGMVEPLVRQVERTYGNDRNLRVNSHLLWPLLARTSWEGVDLQDAAAVRRGFDYAVTRYEEGIR